MSSCRILQNIEKETCSGNAGGIKSKVWAIERSKLIITKEQSTQNDMSWDSGIVTLAYATGSTSADFVTLEFRKQSSTFSSEATIDPAQGVNFWTNTLSMVFARQDVNKRTAIQSLILSGDLALIVEDQNGEIHFMGADDTVEPSAAGATTGTASTDANNYTIDLQDISSELPYYITFQNMVDLGLIPGTPSGSNDGE
jgi:hypothetical protein